MDGVEQVRAALQLDASDFCLFGHSWGGVLAIEHALAHQDRLWRASSSALIALIGPGISLEMMAEIRALTEQR